MHMATNEKFLLEEEQRKSARERKVKMVDWAPQLFERNLITGDWVYKYAEWVRPFYFGFFFFGFFLVFFFGFFFRSLLDVTVSWLMARRFVRWRLLIFFV